MQHRWIGSFLILVASMLTIPEAPAQDEPAKPAPQAKSRTKSRMPRHDDSGRTFMGREIADVMSYLGADWLVRPEREEEERPETMLDGLKLKPGDVVADVGAGVGYTSMRIARRVGPTGKVYSTDVQPQMLKMLKDNARQAGVANITPVLCTATDPRLPEDKIDLAIMVDVYHECGEPKATLQGILKALKPGGRLVLVEFRAEDPDVPIKPEHKMTVDQARKEIEPQGFRFKEVQDGLPWQHVIIFEKPKADPMDKTPKAEKS